MGDYLLFSGYYILELEDIFLDLRVVEAEHHFLVADGEKKRGAQGYIRDQKGGDGVTGGPPGGHSPGAGPGPV